MFRLIVLQSFVQRAVHFDLSTTSSQNSDVCPLGLVEDRFVLISCILNSNSGSTHQLELCDWVTLIRCISLFLRMSCLLGSCQAPPTNAVLSGGRPNELPGHTWYADLPDPRDWIQHRLDYRILLLSFLPSSLLTWEVRWFYLSICRPSLVQVNWPIQRALHLTLEGGDRVDK